MVFEEALKAIKEGKKVRKKDWPKNKYIYLELPAKNRRIVDNEKNFYNLGQNDLFVNEWVEYIEKIDFLTDIEKIIDNFKIEEIKCLEPLISLDMYSEEINLRISYYKNDIMLYRIIKIYCNNVGIRFFNKYFTDGHDYTIEEFKKRLEEYNNG